MELLLLEQVLPTTALASSDFQLQGERTHVEVDRAEPTATFLGIASYRPVFNTSSFDFDNFAIRGLANRPAYEFIVVPGETANIRVESSCAEVTSSRDHVVRAPWVVPESERPPIQVDTELATQLTNCAQADVTITGDFRLSLWQWDFRVESAGQTTEFQTGRLQPHSLADAPDSTAVASRDQQVFLSVKNGTLSIGLARDVPHELFAASKASLHSIGGVRLVDAAGTLDAAGHDMDFNAHRAELQGAVDLEILEVDQNKRLSLRAGGDLEALNLDGSVISLSAAAKAAAPPLSIWLLAACVAAGVLLWLALVRPQRMYWHLQRAEAAKLVNLPAETWRERHAAALTVMGGSLAQNPRRLAAAIALVGACFAFLFHDYRQTHILRAHALHRLGLHGAAFRDHEILDHRFEANPRQRMMNAWMAYQSAQVDRPGDAAKWLAHARECDPVTFAQLQHDLGNPPSGPLLA